MSSDFSCYVKYFDSSWLYHVVFFFYYNLWCIVTMYVGADCSPVLTKQTTTAADPCECNAAALLYISFLYVGFSLSIYDFSTWNKNLSYPMKYCYYTYCIPSHDFVSIIYLWNFFVSIMISWYEFYFAFCRFYFILPLHTIPCEFYCYCLIYLIEVYYMTYMQLNNWVAKRHLRPDVYSKTPKVSSKTVWRTLRMLVSICTSAQRRTKLFTSLSNH